MKKLFLGAIAFSISIILFQISGKKSAIAQTSTLRANKSILLKLSSCG